MTDPDSHPDPKQEDIEVSVSFDPDQSMLRLGIIDPPVRPGLVGNLERFELLKRIGAGGMGVVYLARDSVSGQRVAVKVLKPELLEHATTVRHFLREARLMQALSHPNILPIIEVSDRPSGPFFATPLIEPGSLASRIRADGPLDHDSASDVALQVAEALDYCHKQGVIHRDIKPANVLLDREGQAYLCDLGLGQSLTDVSITYVKEDKRVGTAAYMAPEIARGDAGDFRNDVYSFGAMLYEMLTGQPPYTGETFHAVLAKIQAGPPEPIMSLNPKADGRLTPIAEGAMARELRDRYATMADVAADIERVKKGQPPHGPHEGKLGRLWPRALSRGRLATAALAAAGIVAVALYLGGLFRGPAGDPSRPNRSSAPNGSLVPRAEPGNSDDPGRMRMTLVSFLPGIQKRPGYHAISGLALSPDGSKLYGAHWQAGTVSTNDPVAVWSTADLSLLKEIPAGQCVGEVVVSTNGRYIFAPSYYNGTVSRYDVDNGYANRTLPLGSWANMVWLSPDARRLIVNFRADTTKPGASHCLALIDVAEGSFTRINQLNVQRPVPQARAAFSADSTRMYLGTCSTRIEGAALLEVSIDKKLTVMRKVVLTPGDGDRWALNGVVRFGDLLYTAEEHQRKLHIIDTKTFAEKDVIQLPYAPWNIAPHPDGRHLFILYGNAGVMSAVDLTTLTEVASLKGLRAGLKDIVFASDGRRAYLAHYDQPHGGVSVVSLAEPTSPEGRK